MKKFPRVISTVILFTLFGGLLLLLGQILERSSTKPMPPESAAQPIATLERPEATQPPLQQIVVATTTEVQPTPAPATLLQYATLSVSKDYTAGVGSDTPAVVYSYFRSRVGSDLKSIEAPVPVEIPRSIGFNP